MQSAYFWGEDAMQALTYTIADDGQSITCLVCGMTSHHPKDVEHCHCGKCNKFHDVPDPVSLVDDQFVFLDALLAGNRPISRSHLSDPPQRTVASLYDRHLIANHDGVVEVTVRGKRAFHSHQMLQ